MSVFSAASVLMSSSIDRRASMSRPCVGSSQMSRSGSLMRLAATASRAVMPGVKWAIESPECGSRSTARMSVASFGLRTSRGQAEQPGDVVEVGDRRHAPWGTAGSWGCSRCGGGGRRRWATSTRPNTFAQPAVGRCRPEDEAQERGLAGAVGAEQPEDAARLDGERDVVERDLPVLVDLRQVRGLDDQPGVVRHGGPSPCAPGPPNGRGGGIAGVRGGGKGSFGGLTTPTGGPASTSPALVR